jgi:two-component system phosphate regulon sensor histidine kinase PhoR
MNKSRLNPRASLQVRHSSTLTKISRLFGGYGLSQAKNEPEIETQPVQKDDELLSLRTKRTTEQKNSNASLENAFDILRGPVVVVDENLVVLHANAEARHVFSENLQGRSFPKFFRHQTAISEIKNVFAKQQMRSINISLDVPLKRQYRLSITPCLQNQNILQQAVLEFQETTLIERSENMRSEFIANVSHELRSPLATIIGFIETLTDGVADASAQVRFLGIMDGEAQRMRRLIDDLLSLANIELREHERLYGKVNVCDVLKDVKASLMPRIRASELTVRLDCLQDLPAVMGDRDQLVQIFNNLLTNAIKYGAEGKYVDLMVKANADGLPGGGACIEVHVRDYGQGIEAEHLPRLTERFYRVDKGRSRAVGGTGLGLAIVKHIVNRHRGRFFVESEVGKGSLFKVLLPVHINEAPHVASATKL